MPVFLPPFTMELFPSTMSFLYAVNGKMIHNNMNLHDASTKEDWDLIIPHITPQYQWEEYTSTVKNIRMYKGITSTLTIMNYINGQYMHNSEVDDDPTTHEEWSTISKYMTPKISWENYISTITEIGISKYFKELSNKTTKDLLKCDKIFNIYNEDSIPNIEEWVLYKRKLTNLLSTPSALNRDYYTTSNNYPIEPSTIIINNTTNEQCIKEYIYHYNNLSSLNVKLNNECILSSISKKYDVSSFSTFLYFTNFSSFNHLII